MTRVGGIGNGMAAPRRAGRAAGGFALPDAAGAQAAAAATPAGSVAALLGLQEQAPGSEPPAARGRRRARAALDELRGLQLDLLRGTADPARLERLLALAEAERGITDPHLRDALDEVALRVKVELARRRVASASGA